MTLRWKLYGGDDRVDFANPINMVPIGAGIILAIGPVDHQIGGGENPDPDSNDRNHHERRTAMHRTWNALALAILVALAASPALSADGPAAKVADLAWMTGHWSGPMAGGTLEENWIQPTAGSIASLVRATNGGATSMIELIVIEEEKGSLVLRVQQWNPGFAPRSPAPQVMRLVESAPNKIAFEATGEGGLKRLGYSRPAPDQFVISIETPQGAKFDIQLAAK